MASPAQCFYCFETLAASYKNEEPPSLAAIELSYWNYMQSKQLATVEDKALVEEDEEEEELENNITLPKTIKTTPIARLRQDASSDSSSTTTLSAASSRSALSNSTTLTTPDEHRNSEPPSSADESYPLFVTWNLISRHGHKSLRGCIGTFEPQKLSHGLKEYALISAFDDTRFSPIPSSQLPHLSCSLTLLSNFEICSDPLNWDLGTHGIRISFVHRNRRYGATYLPDVAVEQGWTKEETVESLMRKAGWDGGSGSGGSVARRILRGSNTTDNNSKPWEEVSDFRTTRYQGLMASADYSEWQEWRKWVHADKPRLELLERT
ncbi:AMMECR1 family protein [Talaromyces stipitatus ATCC 10500]|uniref:AMMECR1 family protein n=1 Tax=Talaromyces stipitatus (strain ATCC 10500 / CBS 375.48 / QM 6759 / NRRL 1006) TaxID=441959 RepID=B8M784_TALSN|nr:AMMECR1 family protein [Talaromyces stipitatus ATCC 10500]EED20304.1 AMMECR1 family protein [Talaromyces stipitatus ATCC 10500]